MASANTINAIVKKAQTLPLETTEFGAEFYYNSLPLVVLDAVFSLGISAAQTRNVVTRFCDKTGTQQFRPRGVALPLRVEQLSLLEFEELALSFGADYGASAVYGNRCRTSTQPYPSSILKAEAALRVAQVFIMADVEYLQDIPRVENDATFAQAFREVKGQTYGTALPFIFMLAGSDMHIKPDRHVIRWLEDALGYVVRPDAAQTLLSQAAGQLGITPRFLDYCIWLHMSTAARRAS